MKLVVEVDPGRACLGRLTGHASRGPLFGPVDACATARARAGRAAGNPGRDPLRPGGHVPLGTYRLAGIRETPAEHRDEYGARALVFVPTGGQALHAESYGRLDLLLHAGAPGADGRLRATGGDLRIDEEALEQLVRAARGGAAITLEVVPWPLGLWERLTSRRRKPSEPPARPRDDDDAGDDDWDDDSDDAWNTRWDGGSDSAAPAAAAGAGAAAAASAAERDGEATGGFDVCRPGDEDRDAPAATGDGAMSGVDSGAGAETATTY